MLTDRFRKSSHSNSNGCLEAGAFNASSYSASGECVQAGQFDLEVRVRDSKLRESPVLAFSPAAWDNFLTSLKNS